MLRCIGIDCHSRASRVSKLRMIDENRQSLYDDAFGAVDECEAALEILRGALRSANKVTHAFVGKRNTGAD